MRVNDQDMLERLGVVHRGLRRARKKLLNGHYWTTRMELGQDFGANVELHPYDELVVVGSSISLIERLERAQLALMDITQAVMMGDIEGALGLIDKELP